MDVLGHWKLTVIQRWCAEGMVVFLPFFIYFARLVAIYADKTVRTALFICLNSFRSACGNVLLCIW